MILNTSRPFLALRTLNPAISFATKLTKIHCNDDKSEKVTLQKKYDLKV